MVSRRLAGLPLEQGGHLLVETSCRQASAAADIMVHIGLTPQVATCDDRNVALLRSCDPQSLPPWWHLRGLAV